MTRSRGLGATLETDRLYTWIEIDRKAIAHNLNLFRRLGRPGIKLMPVVKANAYGHGLEQVSRICADEKADYLAVHSIDEAHRVRKAGIDLPVLIMGPVPFARTEELINSGYEIVGYNEANLVRQGETAMKLGKTLKVHLKIETGTHRQGVSGGELRKLAGLFEKYPGLELAGAYTHFANIEDTTDHSYAMEQLRRYNEAVGELESVAGEIPLKHASCSAAGLLFPEAHFDIIRMGIALYGLWPSKETYLSYKLKHGDLGDDLLKPAMTWKARVCQVKRVPKDSFIGYGLTYKATHDLTIAVIPVGYYDGIDRGQSNIASVLIHGQRAQIRGRVCMNLMMADITDIPDVEVEDEVVILGKQGGEEITADHLASHIGSINYEIVTRIGQDIPRIIV